MRGTQDPGPEWRLICAQVRERFIAVCPMTNRRFENEPGTFRRTQMSEYSGVSLSNIRRLVDHRLTVSAESVIRLAEFLGCRLTLERIGPLPVPPRPGEHEAYKYGERPGRTRSGKRRRYKGRRPSAR